MSGRVFTFVESPDSRQITQDPPSITYHYRASGEPDEMVVWGYALSGSPPVVYTSVGALFRQDVRVDPNGYAQYSVTIPYGRSKKENGSFTWNFDTSGATVKVKVAREHIASYPTDAGNPNPHKGAVGVKPDGDVEGAEIVIPALKLTVQFRHPQGIVTIPYAKQLSRATGTTNLNPFLTFEPGELLYLGSTGSDGTETDAEVGYQFAASENVDDLSFGDIVGIVKQGHHYAWVEFKDEKAGGQAAVQPKRVHIERFYNALDFASVFGWSD